ncbi:MAG: hypothetical protein HY271_20035 [Deltaproteobacteria bacterium]|nr:hypothetical protein [Deltaproteobacteria bacterium]
MKDSVRDAALGAATTKLSAGFDKINTKILSKGVDCTDTSLTASQMAAALDAAAADIKDSINGGLNLGTPAEANCGAKLLGITAKKCAGMIKADSVYFKLLNRDPQGTARDAVRANASAKFMTGFNAVVATCPTTATEAGVETDVDLVATDAVTNTSTSPNLSATWTSVVPPTTVQYQDLTLKPTCSRDTPYMYWYKRGTENKLLVYYQGGGACWDDTTCSPSLGGGSPFKNTATLSDNPANTTTGFGDVTNPLNPFSDWSAVFISYCTGDIHWGDNKKLYHDPLNGNQPYTIQHKGYQNAKLVEKFAREHFVAPDEVFVTGSSAGAYGAALGGILLHEVYPAAKFNVVGDAGNGVVTPTFISASLEPSWHVAQHMPTYIPSLNVPITSLTIADLYIGGATYYLGRGSRFGQYTSAWDGGSGSQTFFYNVMVNGLLDNANWWHSSCAWNTQMLANDAAAFAGAPTNYRSYVGPGSRHTIYGSNRVYTETHGVPQTFVSWLDNMRNQPLPANWNNVLCSDCSLLGVCDGSSPSPGVSCQHDAECSPGVCTPVDARPTPGQNPPNPFLADGVVNCS